MNEGQVKQAVFRAVKKLRVSMHDISERCIMNKETDYIDDIIALQQAETVEAPSYLKQQWHDALSTRPRICERQKAGSRENRWHPAIVISGELLLPLRWHWELQLASFVSDKEAPN